VMEIVRTTISNIVLLDTAGFQKLSLKNIAVRRRKFPHFTSLLFTN